MASLVGPDATGESIEILFDPSTDFGALVFFFSSIPMNPVRLPLFSPLLGPPESFGLTWPFDPRGTSLGWARDLPTGKTETGVGFPEVLDVDVLCDVD